MATKLVIPPHLATYADVGEWAEDECRKREGLMSMLGSLRKETAEIEAQLSELAAVLSPLLCGPIDAPWIADADEREEKEAREQAPALIQIDRLRARLSQIGQFVRELSSRAAV